MVVELGATSMGQATAMCERVSTFMKDVLFTELDKTITETLQNTAPHMRHEISKIEVEIEVKKLNDFSVIKEEITTQIRRQILQNIERNTPGGEGKKMLKKDNVKGDAFLHFLKTGNYPWWYKAPPKRKEHELENLLKTAKFIEKLPGIIYKSNNLDRFILYIDNK